ncbi:splicing factor 3A subunit 1 [Neodiprion pinetum]|uniref:Splicing factor 3A subunit 1 n=1 Tax=Neodiprion lecontei TaxID=441921 RepID=A0A6J0B713_NEOLC|nr:splicing factor 3A subunit 1 [Neodiprion lecontei]XP_046435039.1 splicing factor 3A subunit 1 [Neodiprion fabricii]XP_046435049.1 splicing factor 3A subunit 1 [Neodiprion fabricii]XP_046492631.1 splicing factor 3A subunit 1 [Neodiprion pinetum]XP_046492632.1 splicing factor 3A subunit 1 [Neodiprion pinetum]XP_046629665.1 splicing factor 3A subunit 1 [Neodiprion virginianus]XP_046629666.1 splicing factor 3A subunit 1 [Neodiprion virginianus]
MPAQEIVTPQPAEVEDAAPSSQPIVGIIYPPPEVRNIVDKTASFVARNGPEFESRIRQNELGNPKFNFLNFGDPYHAYYQHKVKEFKEGKAQEPVIGLGVGKGVNLTAHQKQQEILKQVEQPFVPKDPPVDFEFIADPPSISALDLDIVKLTAQFVARNGRQFLTNLMNREQRNFQFDFLRPQHSLFQYFTKLLEQYTKVLIPPKDLLPRLRDEAANMDKILEQVKYRAEWLKYQEAQRRKEEEELERERVAYAQIDWHDFVVVETVDYQQFEVGNFPAPTTPDEVGARVLMQERIEDGEEVEMQIESDGDEELHSREGEKDRAKDNNQVQDMEEDSSDDDDVSPPGDSNRGKDQRHRDTMQPPPLPPTPGNVVVKKGYDPKQHASVKNTRPTAPDEYLISPITGERIPASKVQEHMRIGLLDPRWVEQRDKHLDKLAQETVFAPGTAIEASLKQLAERRTDIFGVGDEETAIGKKIGEEDKKKDDKVTWDGHTSSVEAATRAARANITLEEQIHQIHKVKGLLPDEEKEKIGPKPATRAAELSHMAAAASKPQATLKAPPKPPAPKPVPVPAQPPPPSIGMSTMGIPQPIMPQPPMMMMAPMPPIRPPPLMTPAMSPFMPTPPPMQPPLPSGIGIKHPGEPMEEEPQAKKLRTEDSLIPEQQFLARNKGPVQVNIAVPMMTEKAEWKLNGQTLNITLQLSDTIATMKASIHEQTGMPPGKQKLQYEGMFFKDNNTLGYYNLASGNVINLLPKERGGRKK